MAKELDESTKEKLVRAQRNEITEYRIYRKLADYVSDSTRLRSTVFTENWPITLATKKIVK